MDLKAKIKEVTRQLTWRVEYQPNNTKDLEILSNPETKTHTIYVPDNPKDPVGPLEHLHELAHAVLSERDLFLAGGVYDLNIQDHRYNLVPAIRAVDDWWADYLVDSWCPDEARADIADHLEMIYKALQFKAIQPHEFFGIALIIAEGIYYCKAEITLPGHLQPAVQAFLDHPPDKPSREAAEEIAQVLFDVTGINLKIKFIESDGKPFWTVEKKGE
ncbi:MAG: hypothetical protein WC251_03825 [Candidatus Izemoplasmatales bacterium]|nr:hypothetical protein [Dehalococcoidia bacterium]